MEASAAVSSPEVSACEAVSGARDAREAPDDSPNDPGLAAGIFLPGTSAPAPSPRAHASTSRPAHAAADARNSSNAASPHAHPARDASVSWSLLPDHRPHESVDGNGSSLTAAASPEPGRDSGQLGSRSRSHPAHVSFSNNGNTNSCGNADFAAVFSQLGTGSLRGSRSDGSLRGHPAATSEHSAGGRLALGAGAGAEQHAHVNSVPGATGTLLKREGGGAEGQSDRSAQERHGARAGTRADDDATSLSEEASSRGLSPSGSGDLGRRFSWAADAAEEREPHILRWAASDSLLDAAWCRKLRTQTGYALSHGVGNLRRESFDAEAAAPGGSEATNRIDQRPARSAGWVLAKQYLLKLAEEVRCLDRLRRGTTEFSHTSSGFWGRAPVKHETLEDLLEIYERQLRWPSPPTCELLSAYDPYLGEHVMIKVYIKRHLNDRLLSRVALELRLASRLKHANLVLVHCTLDNQAACAVVMELCTVGELLREIVLRADFTESHVFSSILRPIVLAVQYLHEQVGFTSGAQKPEPAALLPRTFLLAKAQAVLLDNHANVDRLFQAVCVPQGVVHCDITPGNVLLRSNGEVCLCDLSNAIDLSDPGDYGKPQRVGSLDYLPPEMLQLPTPEELRAGVDASDRTAPVGPPVDIWQVGCLAFELLTGRAPFEFPDVDMTAAAIMFGYIDTWPTGISEKAKAFIGKCLEKDPAKRPTAKELLTFPVLKAAAVLPTFQGAYKAGLARRGLCGR